MAKKNVSNFLEIRFQITQYDIIKYNNYLHYFILYVTIKITIVLNEIGFPVHDRHNL
jgi:hypothetical protein